MYTRIGHSFQAQYSQSLQLFLHSQCTPNRGPQHSSKHISHAYCPQSVPVFRYFSLSFQLFLTEPGLAGQVHIYCQFQGPVTRAHIQGTHHSTEPCFPGSHNNNSLLSLWVFCRYNTARTSSYFKHKPTMENY